MNKKSVLITGAAGFLGSHLCDKFLNNGYNVYGIDNLITGSINNINHLKNNNSFEFIEHDVTKKINLKLSPEYILHFASPASPVDYLKYPVETLRIGSIGSINILDFANSNNSIILVASTSEVYGDPLIHPQHEDYFGNVNPIGPRSVYDEAKRFMESLTMAYSNKYGLNTRIVRIFNTYGPRMRVDDGRALPTFLDQSINNKDITVFGDGSQTRSFCYVSDLVEGITKLLFSEYKYPVNIGNNEEIKLLEFAKQIIYLTQSKSKIIFKPLPLDDPKKRRPNLDRANSILNWTPKIKTEDGLKLTYEYFKNNLK